MHMARDTRRSRGAELMVDPGPNPAALQSSGRRCAGGWKGFEPNDARHTYSTNASLIISKKNWKAPLAHHAIQAGSKCVRIPVELMVCE